MSVVDIDVAEFSPFGPVEVRLRDEGRIEGVVLSQDDDPIADASIRVLDSAGDRISSAGWEARTNQLGAFEVRSLAPGIYSIVAKSDSGQGTALNVTVIGGETTSEVIRVDRH